MYHILHTRGVQPDYIMTKSLSTFHQKSSKIVLKSRSRGGLGNSWGLSLLQIALSWASWGALGGIWHQKPAKKGEKHDLFGCFWTVLGGVLAPMWAPRGHLGCILGVLGSILGAFGEIWGAFFGHFVACAAFQKTLKNLRFFNVF